MFKFLGIFSLIILCSCHSEPPKEAIKNKSQKNAKPREIKIQDSALVINLGSYMHRLNLKCSQIRLVVDKSDRKLRVYHKQQIIKEYPVVLGLEGNDDKLMQGDRKTPEGTFHISSKYKHAKWSRFMLLNYPTSESWKKHNKAKKEGLIPQNADIGNAIGIHGVPDNDDSLIDEGVQWTLGCVSLKNKDVNELYACINEQTEIIIKK
jgi:murein L,D-transpeptidase YafK